MVAVCKLGLHACMLCCAHHTLSPNTIPLVVPPPPGDVLSSGKIARDLGTNQIGGKGDLIRRHNKLWQSGKLITESHEDACRLPLLSPIN
jgi:hypothetical protein